MADAARVVRSGQLGRLPFLGARSATLLTNVALLVSGTVTSVAISRLLGPAGRGDYVTWQAWSAAIAIAALGGLPQVMVIEDWSSRRHRLRDLLMPLAVTAAVGASVAVVVGSSFLRAHELWVGLLLVVVATQAAAVAAAEAQRAGRMTGAFNIVRLLPPVTALICIGVLVLAGVRSPALWLTSIAAAQVCVLLASLVWVTRAVHGTPRRSGSWRKTLAAAARLGPGAWITMLQYRADVLAVSLIFPSEVVGYYAVGVAAQAAVAAGGQVGGQHWFARVGRSGGDSPSLRGELLRTAGVALLGASVLGVSAPWWVPALYGSAFAPALPLVLGMCASAVVQSLDYLLAHEMLLLGRGSRVALYRLPAGLFLVTGFATVAVLDLDPLAAVFCTAAGYALSATVMGLVARRYRRRAGLEDLSPPAGDAVLVAAPGRDER